MEGWMTIGCEGWVGVHGDKCAGYGEVGGLQ